jgi:hypothetical protein
MSKKTIHAQGGGLLKYCDSKNNTKTVALIDPPSDSPNPAPLATSASSTGDHFLFGSAIAALQTSTPFS